MQQRPVLSQSWQIRWNRLEGYSRLIAREALEEEQFQLDTHCQSPSGNREGGEHDQNNVQNHCPEELDNVQHAMQLQFRSCLIDRFPTHR